MVQISRYQLILIMVWTVLGTGIVTIPASIAQFTVEDAWLAAPSVVLGGAVCALLAWFHVWLFPELTLTQVFRTVFGRWTGDLLSAWYALMLLISMATIGREFSLFVTTAALPNTPELLASGLAFACIAYIGYEGIEALARANEFVVPLAVVVTPLLFLLALRWFDAAQFRPFLAAGLGPVWRAAIVPAFLYGLEFSLVLQWIPVLRTPRTVHLDIFITSMVCGVVLTAVIVLTVGVIGPATKYLNYPVLELVRIIRVGKFIERLDTLYGMAVVTTLVFKLSAFQTALCQALQDMCRTPDKKWAVLPTAIAACSGSYFLFRNVSQMTDFILYVVPGWFLFTLVGLPLVTYAFGVFVRGRGAKKRV